MKLFSCLFFTALLITGCKHQITNLQPDTPARYSIKIGIEPTDRPLTDGQLEEVFQLLTKQAEGNGIACQSIVKDAKQRNITFNVIGLLAKNEGEAPGINYFARTLSSSSSLGFWEVYRTDDDNVKTAFNGIFERYNLEARMIPNFSSEVNPNYYNSPVVAYVKPEQVPFIDSIFKLPEVTAVLPADIVLALSHDTISGTTIAGFFELYMLKKTKSSGPFLTGKDIATINGSMEKGSETVSIDVAFKPKAAVIWAEKTRAAAADSHREVGMVIDGWVITAPRVMSEITDGQSSITGNFNVAESSRMINKLKLGSLPCELKIVEAKKL